MRIICDAPGQTCNRLWSYVDTLTKCIVNDETMIIVFVDTTIEDFPNFRKCPFIYFPFYNKWLLSKGRNWGRYKHLTWKITHNYYFDKIFRALGSIRGWQTRNNTTYISQTKEQLKFIFKPSYEIVCKAESLINGIRQDFDLIVGVHIRRGDYSTWRNGSFYYSFEVYNDFLKQIENLYKDKKVAFFISSNEPLSRSYFEGSSCFFYDSSRAVEDLYTLSLCDQIIGPFSTFSRWASFIGEKPLCFLEYPNMKIEQSNFSEIIDFFHFADGREIEDW